MRNIKKRGSIRIIRPSLNHKLAQFLIIGYLFTISMVNSATPGAATRPLEWKVHELLTTPHYERSRIVESFEEGGALFTRSSLPTRARTQAVMVYRAESDSSTPESLLFHGVDRRVRITPTDIFPNSIHGQMFMDFKGNKTYGGSGVLIGPHHFLTAGHNVFDHDHGLGLVQNIRVRLALDGDSAPFGEAQGSKVYVCNEWIATGNPEYDIALVVLNHSVGYETGWSGLLSLPDAELSSQTVHVTGYPGDKRFSEMWTMDYSLAAVEDEKFSYAIDTTGGQSGGAVWIRKWGSPHVLGVHTLGGRASNSGVRLSRSKLEIIVRLIEETGNIRAPSISSGAMGGYGFASSSMAEPLAPAVPRPIDIVIPEIARGHEEVYRRFVRGVLIYKQGTAEEVRLPISSLANPLDGVFDLSRCGDTGKQLYFATGYRKAIKPENANKVEFWFAPRFLMERNLALSASHYGSIMEKWDGTRAPAGIFCNWGGGKLEHYQYEATKSFDEVGTQNLWDSWRHFTPAFRLWHPSTPQHPAFADFRITF